MKIIAHRGASREAPENTPAAFSLAWELGADGAELDVRLTRDGRLAVIHDESTLRTTGVDLVVESVEWARLHALDAGRWKGESWAGERIVALPEILSAQPREKELMIELKGNLDAARALRAELQKAEWKSNRIVLLCFDRAALREAKRDLPVRAYWNIEPPAAGDLRDPSDVQRFVRQACADEFQGLSFGDWPGLTPAVISAVKSARLGVAVWTVDEPRRAAELRLAGIDYLMTNDPRAIHS